MAVPKITARLNILQPNLRPLQKAMINIADKVVTIIGILFVNTNDAMIFIKERYPDYQKVCTDYAGCCGTYPAFYALACP